MTKDQEREVLQKIKKLIDSTGSDSYISAAFEGCIDLANDNIDNDWCMSFKDAAETAHANEMKAEAIAQERAEQITYLEDKVECQDIVIKQLEEKNTILNTRIEDIAAEKIRALEDAIAKQKEVDQLKSEIITLKAKLCDLISQ